MKLGAYRRHRQNGPSFNNLKVPYNLSIVAVTERFGGHELVVKRMTWALFGQVAKFVAIATRTNPYLARISDGWHWRSRRGETFRFPHMSPSDTWRLRGRRR